MEGEELPMQAMLIIGVIMAGMMVFIAIVNSVGKRIATMNTQDNEPPRRRMKECQYCSSQIPAQANVCSYCGRWVSAPRPNCFIASAVYGDSAAEVAVLRTFRDRFLVKSSIGKSCMNLYYKTAPHATPFIRSHRSVRLVLKPLLGVMVLIATWCIRRRQNKA